jgi:hypothetical protein
MANLSYLKRNEFRLGISRKGQIFTEYQEFELLMAFVLDKDYQNDPTMLTINSLLTHGSDPFTLLNDLDGAKEVGRLYTVTCTRME